MVVERNLVRRGRPPKIHLLNGKEYTLTVKGVTLKFEKGIAGLRRVDRNAGVDKHEIDYAKSVVLKYVKDLEAEAAHRANQRT